MKRLAMLFAFLLLTGSAFADQWKKVELFVTDKPATSRGDLFWSTVCDPNYPTRPCPLTNPPGLARDVWNVIDVTALGVPADASHIFVSGTLIISHANAGGYKALTSSGTVTGLVNSTGYLDASTGTVHTQAIAQIPVSVSGIIERVVNETANLKVGFRAYGDTTPIDNNTGEGLLKQWYLGHAVEVDTGQRSTWATFVPVRQGKIEMKFVCDNGHSGGPILSACALNLSVQAYGRTVPAQ